MICYSCIFIVNDDEVCREQNNLITVTSDTNILQAMKIMTGKGNSPISDILPQSLRDKKGHVFLAENHIRHVPVIDGKIVGMISIVDVVRAVMEQQSGELKRLHDYIKGEYY